MKMMFIGLGLIGGSMALALSNYPGLTCYAVDRDDATRFEALNRSAVQACWKDVADAPLEEMDVVVLCLHPQASADFVRLHAARLAPGTLLTDVCGVKRPLAQAVADLGKRSFIYLGGHPMAGKERGGFTSATDSLYVGASMILTPDKRTDMLLLETLKHFFLDLGFANLTFSDPEEHDRIIAFTSQLAHIASSAYVKSPEAQRRRGFSAGSFRDMTRVARLDEDMWTELFLDDADYLTKELDILIQNLTEYADALKARDAEKLRALLKDGREKKATAGGN